MGWSIGFDTKWQRDIGYGVPAVCDHPECSCDINRGLAYVCCGEEPCGGDGCGLFFCTTHLIWSERLETFACERCDREELPFVPKPDTDEWIQHKRTHPSWEAWRVENPKF